MPDKPSREEERNGYEFHRRSVLIGGTVAVGTLGFGLSGGQLVATQRAVAASHNMGVPNHLQTKLVADDGDSEDHFGSSVALDGDTAVVGTPGDEDPNGSEGGSVYVFTRTGGVWSQQSKLSAGDGDSDDRFGFSVAIAGNMIVIGAPGDEDPNGSEAGSAYVFTYSGGNWSQQTKLDASDGQSGDELGFTVAIDGDTAVIGARSATVTDPTLGSVRAGATYVFTRSGTTWTEQEKLVVSDSPNDDLVSAVAIDGDTLVVGDEGDSSGSSGGDLSGAAYVFTRSAGTWSSPTKILAGDRSRFDEFGNAVAVDGDTIVVGANGADDPNGEHAGAAYVFTLSSSGWAQQAKLVASDGTRGDQFGYSVALDGDTIVIGPFGVDDPEGGSAYVFTRDGSTWSETTLLTPDDGDKGDNFGGSVALDGATAVGGAPQDADPNGTAAGSAYVFGPNTPPTASFTVETDPVVRNEAVRFDASSSEDPDGTIVTYEWDWDDDGTFEARTGDPTIEHTFATGGTRTVTLRVTDDDGATSETAVTFNVFIDIDIDIKPGPGRNPINPRSKGQIPVAVLHTASFDPTKELAASSVRFGDPDDVGFDEDGEPVGGAAPSHGDGHIEDVDDDRDMDRMFHFPTQATDFESSDTEGKLVGLTTDGVPVFGTDSVTVKGH